MTHRSKSTLFLIEQLIVIAVFAVCAAACIRILTAAYFTANDSQATSHAVLRAESAAEVFKAVDGDLAAVARIMGADSASGGHQSDFIVIYYDSSWQLSDESTASYVLNLRSYPPQSPDDFSLVTGVLTVSKTTDEVLVAFPVATRSG